MIFKKLSAALFGIVMAVSFNANAGLITSNILNSATTIDFSDQSYQTDVIGAVQIGGLVGIDVTVKSSSNSNGLYFNYNGWGMLNNGDWGNNRTYVSLNGSNDSILFSFNDGPVSGVGGLVSYARRDNGGTDDLIFSVFDNSMSLLESINITNLADIIETGFNGSAFRGIKRNTADISYFSISGGLANAIDNLSFEIDAQSTTIPEPSTLAIFALGIMGLAARRFKKQ